MSIEPRSGSVEVTNENVTRLEAISNEGREFVLYNLPGVRIVLQDDERTLKIFPLKGVDE